MADNLDETQLRANIAEIIKNGDLATLTSKKIRQILETKYEVNLMHRKKQIDDIVMQLVDEQSDDSDDNAAESPSKSDKKSSKESESSEKESKSPIKSERVSVISTNKTDKKRKAKEDSNSDEAEIQSESEDSDEDAPKPKRKSPVKRAKSKSKAAKPKAEKGEGGKKGSGFSKPMLLSPELAALMGETNMARSEVVKKMWQIIKERNLMDPTNKRYTLCDEELEKIIGQKRFMTFAMMKYLKKHVKDPALM